MRLTIKFRECVGVSKAARMSSIFWMPGLAGVLDAKKKCLAGIFTGESNLLKYVAIAALCFVVHDFSEPTF